MLSFLAHMYSPNPDYLSVVRFTCPHLSSVMFSMLIFPLFRRSLNCLHVIQPLRRAASVWDAPISSDHTSVLSVKPHSSACSTDRVKSDTHAARLIDQIGMRWPVRRAPRRWPDSRRLRAMARPCRWAGMRSVIGCTHHATPRPCLYTYMHHTAAMSNLYILVTDTLMDSHACRRLIG